jgi:hypothetical protein
MPKEDHTKGQYGTVCGKNGRQREQVGSIVHANPPLIG